jgi:hypothetical protein
MIEEQARYFPCEFHTNPMSMSFRARHHDRIGSPDRQMGRKFHREDPGVINIGAGWNRKIGDAASLALQRVGMVLLAAAIAFPVAWYGLNGFLQGYAYRTDLSWWVFGAAGAITLFVALLTVIFKCFQAALANPVKSLRAE